MDRCTKEEDTPGVAVVGGKLLVGEVREEAHGMLARGRKRGGGGLECAKEKDGWKLRESEEASPVGVLLKPSASSEASKDSDGV